MKEQRTLIDKAFLWSKKQKLVKDIDIEIAIKAFSAGWDAKTKALRLKRKGERFDLE